jgi:hypothetical protein
MDDDVKFVLENFKQKIDELEKELKEHITNMETAHKL